VKNVYFSKIVNLDVSDLGHSIYHSSGVVKEELLIIKKEMVYHQHILTIAILLSAHSNSIHK